MSEKVLRDASGRRIGTIRESAGRQEIRDSAGRRLGTYDPKDNKTRNSSGQVFGQGDQLSSLLR
jgi:hypothetical protein